MRAGSNASKTFDQYTRLINHGITLTQNMVFTLPTQQSLKLGRVFQQIVILREQAGLERGRVFQALLHRHFSNEEYFAIAGHIQQQQLIFELFRLNATHKLLSWWQVKADESTLRTIEKVRNILRQGFQNQQVLAEFLKEVGYDGFIHHYKNYLLRGDPGYYEKAQQHINRALSLLKTWLHAPYTSTAQQNDIQVLLNTFTHYQQKLQDIKQLHQQQLPVSVIDQRVRVDDRTATAAISSLQQLHLDITPLQWWHIASKRIQLFSQLLDQVEQALSRHIAQAHAQLSQQQNLIIGSLILFLGALGYLFFALWRQLKTFTQLLDIVTDMSRKNRFEPFQLKEARNEIRQLVIAFNQLITDRLEHEKNIWKEANLDPLTNLPNRKYLYDILQYLVKDAKRRKESFALLFLDLDGFKAINDTEGHKAGDELLKILAKRFSSILRQNDIVARIGGDEFVIVLPHITSEAGLEKTVSKLLAAINNPVTLSNGKTVRVSGSIGITLFPEDAADVDTLMMHADIAMYAAKAAGKNTSRFYRPDLLDNIHEKQALIELMEQVTDGDYAAIGFELYYQPIMHLQDNRIHHFEALLRWHHPEKGQLPPMRFIPLLEDTKLIIPLTQWIAEQALRQAQALTQTFKRPYPIAINLSAVQAEEHFRTLIETLQKLEDTGFDLALLHLEMTESLVLSQDNALLEVLNWFKSKGCILYLDDFGTGYSALSYLKHFPFDVLKIDRAFIKDIREDDQDYALVMAILSLAEALDMAVVAEGVEDAETLETLKLHGCDYVQGYHIAAPMPAGSLMAWLKQHPVTL